MKIDAIKKIARHQQLKPGKAKKDELIRAIQQAEGNTACFGSNSAKECGQVNCLWREDCL